MIIYTSNFRKWLREALVSCQGDNMSGNERKIELMKLFEGCDDLKDVLIPLVDEIVFLEGQLEKLRRLPFIRINPEDISQQKATPASKQYKEMLQQYNNCIKTLTGILRKDATEEESPLREFMRKFND